MSKNNILRPKTRGELVQSLKDGIPCEVVATNEQITTLLITGWLDFYDFTTRPSENAGWVIYEPTK